MIRMKKRLLILIATKLLWTSTFICCLIQDPISSIITVHFYYREFEIKIKKFISFTFLENFISKLFVNNLNIKFNSFLLSGFTFLYFSAVFFSYILNIIFLFDMCEVNAKEIVEISKKNEVNELLGICVFPFGLY